MKEKLEQIKAEAVAKIQEADVPEKLNDVRVKFLGKKGELTAVLKGMKDVAPEERPKVGQLVNDTRAAIEELLEESKAKMEKAIREEKMKAEVIDVTLPSKKNNVGHRHPNTIALEEVERIFIAKTALIAKGFREAGQTAANTFRTFADKPEVDYSQKEQKHPITKAVLAPMKAVKKMLVSMELHLDASIDKLDNLAMNVKLDKEKHMENIKEQEQTESERAEAERVEAEVVYSPMVTEPQEYR